MTSWVDTTCPQGWDVEIEGMEMCYAHRGPEYPLLCDWSGDVQWCDSLGSARRLAWQRWALDVLGDRLTWAYDQWGDPMVLTKSCMCVSDGDSDTEIYLLYSDVHQHAPPSQVSDPVEALARLAALVLALEGPEQ